MKNLLILSLLFLISCAQPTFEEAGGVRVVLEAHSAAKTDLDRIMLILTQRLNAFGIDNPTIRMGEKPEHIVVEIPGKDIDLQRLRSLLQSSAKLEFWETYENEEIYNKLMEVNDQLSKELYPDVLNDTVEENSKELIAESKEEVKLTGTMEEQFAAQKSDEELQEEAKQIAMKKHPLFTLLQPSVNYDMQGMPTGLSDGPCVGVSLLTDTAKVNSLLNSETAKKILGRNIKFLWTEKSSRVNDPFKPKKMLELIAIKIPRTNKAPLSENIIDDARVKTDNYMVDISITMNQIAAFDWQKMTKENVGKSIAIVLDDIVYSYPVVQGEIRGGQISISGGFTKEEAESLVGVMKSGCLPVRVSIVSEEVVAAKK